MLPTFSPTPAEDVAHPAEYTNRLVCSCTGLASSPPSPYCALHGGDAAARRCTGTLRAAGADGTEVVDHDGDCGVHDR